MNKDHNDKKIKTKTR